MTSAYTTAGCCANDSAVPSGRRLCCIYHDNTGRSKCTLYGNSAKSITFQAHQDSYLRYICPFQLLLRNWFVLRCTSVPVLSSWLWSDGEWVEMEKLVQKTPLKDHKHFLYSVYKQQYLELIEQLEYQKVCNPTE